MTKRTPRLVEALNQKCGCGVDLPVGCLAPLVVALQLGCAGKAQRVNLTLKQALSRQHDRTYVEAPNHDLLDDSVQDWLSAYPDTYRKGAFRSHLLQSVTTVLTAAPVL